MSNKPTKDETLQTQLETSAKNLLRWQNEAINLALEGHTDSAIKLMGLVNNALTYEGFMEELPNE